MQYITLKIGDEISLSKFSTTSKIIGFTADEVLCEQCTAFAMTFGHYWINRVQYMRKDIVVPIMDDLKIDFPLISRPVLPTTDNPTLVEFFDYNGFTIKNTDCDVIDFYKDEDLIASLPKANKRLVEIFELIIGYSLKDIPKASDYD